MTEPATQTRYTYRICPFYRLPQLHSGRTLDDVERQPLCVALDPAHRVHEMQARRLCRSGEYRTCPRFQIAQPDAANLRAVPRETPLGRRLLSSALWVIGIPVVITFLILLAAWLTEHVWLPSQMGASFGIW